MNVSMRIAKTRRRALPVLAVACALIVGCGGDEQSEEGGGGASEAMPASVALDFMLDVTGPAQVYTKDVKRGLDLRIKEANEAGELGQTKLSANIRDQRGDPRAAANVMTEVANSDAPLALFGTGSDIAPAVAPVAQREEVPLITIFSGGPGVVDVGDYIYRVTAPQSSYHDLQSQYLKSQGAKRVAMIYNNDNGTLKDLAENFYPEAAERDGYEIVETAGVPVAATDISSELTGIANSQPDAVLMLVLLQQNATVVNRLRGAGFEGVIAAQPGIDDSALKSLGDRADGVVWPTDFSPATETESGQQFVAAFEAEYGSLPDTFAASGYDGTTMAIEALKAAPEFTREGLQQGLTEVTSKGFDGAAGPLTFEERDARVDGIMVEWQNGKETLLETGG